VDLGAHLGNDPVLLGRPLQGQALGRVDRHRLLHVDVLLRLAGVDRLERVPVRRRGDNHAVDVVPPEHLAVVVVRLGGFLELVDEPLALRLPDVADAGDGHVVVLRAVVQVGRAHQPGADQADADAVVGRGLAFEPEGAGRNVVSGKTGGAGRGRPADALPP